GPGARGGVRRRGAGPPGERPQGVQIPRRRRRAARAPATGDRLADADHRDRRHGRRPRARRDREGRGAGLARDGHRVPAGGRRAPHPGDSRDRALQSGAHLDRRLPGRDRHGRDPHEAVKNRRDASLLVAARAVAEGRADAMISAGNTAACVLTCARYFRLLKGIRRAALASVYPRHTEYTGQDPLALMLDVGATIRCESEELVQFALMGSAYARRISKVPSPRVALLNMGVEGTKGGETLVAAYRRLRRMPALNFVGNVEGNDLARGRADVVVCEGLLGNVVLRLVEGIADVFTDV